MENRTITANCDNGRLSDNLLSMQYDNNRTVVEFANAPTAEKYYILVYMKIREDADPVMMSPIELAGASWTVSNVYTQIVQTVRFQLCCLDEATNHIEAHSKVFNGQISDSLEHDGTVQDVDVTELFDAYREYINQLVVAAGAIVIDPTLSVQGAAADAKAVGDRIAELEQGGTGGLTADIKAALLACFNHVAWDSADPAGQSYISALQTALYPPANLSRITAVYTQPGTVWSTDTLDSLKPNLVVTAFYSDNTSEVISNYTLSGSLTAGTSTITASYGGKTATFTVVVNEYSTSPVIRSVGKGYSDRGEELSQNGTSTTEPMSVGKTFTVADGVQRIMIFAPRAEGASFSSSKVKIPRYLDGVFVNYNNMAWVTYGDESATEQQVTPGATEYNQMAFTLATGYEEDSYAYVLDTGYIIFAGRNTKYYGKSNISEVS